MALYKLVKSTFFLFFLLPHSNSLKPIKLPSGKDRVYKYNKNNPESDIKKITAMEASFISRHWLNNILEPKRICEEDTLIVEKINSLEEFIQTQFTNHKELGVEYLVWSPQCITNDILFLIVIETFESKNVLRMLINSPFWESKQISNDYLLKSLKRYSSMKGKVLYINDFLDENIRYKLMWKDYNAEILQ